MMLLPDRLEARLTEAADATKAAAMRAYMKSSMPYLGVSATPLRRVCRAVFAGLLHADAEAWRDDVLAIWRGARFREQRYAAIELTGIKAARPFQRFGALKIYEEMILTGAWWGYVDPIAAHRLWALLRNDPAPMKRAMLAWSRDDNLWKRRAAILCQLQAKEATDFEFLRACMEPSFSSKEFFLRKAIGWALRQHARTDADAVWRFVDANREALSGLSQREALKHVSRKRPERA